MMREIIRGTVFGVVLVAVTFAVALVTAPAWAALPTANENNTGAEMLGTQCAMPVGTPVVPATYDDAGVNAAIAAAAGGSNVVDLRANFTPTTRIVITAGVTVMSSTQATVASTSTTTGFEPTSNTRITGLRLTGTRPLQLQSSTAVSNVTINCNTFEDAAFGLRDNATADNSNHTNVVFQWNKAIRTDYVVNSRRAREWRVVDNFARDSPFRTIELQHCILCEASRNRLMNSRTGIVWLSDNDNNRFSAHFIGNVTADNWISGMQEESIMVEINPSTLTKTGLLDNLTVGSKSGTVGGGNATLVAARPAAISGNACGGYFATMLTGTMKGHAWALAVTCTHATGNISLVFRNTQLGNERMITQAEFDAINVGDVLMLGHQSVNDRIENNFIDEYFTGINIYGMGVYTRITGNIFGRPIALTNQSTFQQITAGKAINIMAICGLTANNKTTAQVPAADACAAPAHLLVTGNSTGPDVAGNTVTEAIRVYGKTFDAGTQPVFTDDWTWPHTIRGNASGAVENLGWVNQANTALIEHAVADSGSLSNNHGITAQGDPRYLGGTNPRTAEGFKLRATSPLIRAGICTLAVGCSPRDFGGRRGRVPPDIGAWQRRAGD